MKKINFLLSMSILLPNIIWAGTETGNGENDFEKQLIQSKNQIQQMLKKDYSEFLASKVSKLSLDFYNKNKTKLASAAEQAKIKVDYDSECSFQVTNGPKKVFCLGDKDASSIVWISTTGSIGSDILVREKLYFYKYKTIVPAEITTAVLHEVSHHLGASEITAIELSSALYQVLASAKNRVAIIEPSPENYYDQNVTLPLLGVGYGEEVNLSDIPGFSTTTIKGNILVAALKALVFSIPPEFKGTAGEKAIEQAYYNAINQGIGRCNLLQGEITKVLNPQSVQRIDTITSRHMIFKAEALVTCKLNYKKMLILSNWYEDSSLLSDNKEIPKLGGFKSVLAKLNVNSILENKGLSLDQLIQNRILEKANEGKLNELLDSAGFDIRTEFIKALEMGGKFNFRAIQQEINQANPEAQVIDKKTSPSYEFAQYYK